LDVVARIDVAVEATLEGAYDALRYRVARYVANSAPGFERLTAAGVEVPARLRALASGIGYTHDPQRLAPVAAEVTPEMRDLIGIAATPETLGARLGELVRRGATQIILNPVAPEDRVETVIDAAGAWKAARPQGPAYGRSTPSRSPPRGGGAGDVALP